MNESGKGLAPVISMFGDVEVSTAEPNTTEVRAAEVNTAEVNSVDESDVSAGTSDAVSAAEHALVKKLAGRGLSVAEARAFLAHHGGIGADDVEEILARFLDRRYLDDDALAEQIVSIGWERKQHGRRRIAQTLGQRRLSTETIENALAALPDDEWQRAYEFAQTKVRSVGGRDPDAALRRLVGQLARRGFSGQVAMSASRAAIDEHLATG